MSATTTATVTRISATKSTGLNTGSEGTWAKTFVVTIYHLIDSLMIGYDWIKWNVRIHFRHLRSWLPWLQSTALGCTGMIQIRRKEKNGSSLSIACFWTCNVNSYLIRQCMFVHLKKLPKHNNRMSTQRICMCGLFIVPFEPTSDHVRDFKCPAKWRRVPIRW